ncbi:MAG: hypothetical protein IJJ01_03220 [Firmicutes bacterium]|nr:hypothetical protein [Bacillota bacterium]
MDFKNAYSQADELLKKWGEKGVIMAGDSDTDWIFKGHVVPNDKLSGSLLLVDKNNGEMRLFNVGRRRDRDVGRTAKPITI